MITKLTIDRSKWACKHNNDVRTINDAPVSSELLDEDGFMCCLGFLALACKVPRTKLIGNQTFASLFAGYVSHKMPVEFTPERITLILNMYTDTELTKKAYAINDNMKNNAARERNIQKIFDKAGVKVKFTGEYLKKIS